MQIIFYKTLRMNFTVLFIYYIYFLFIYYLFFNIAGGKIEN